MVRRWLTILILLALVTGLGGWVYWLERAPEPKSPPLAKITPETVRHIVIERQNDRLEFERRGESWHMIQPFNAPADAYHFEQLLALPNQTSQTRYATAELDLARFELDPPRVIVRLEDTEFRFGGQNPLNFQRYLQVGAVIHLIDDTLFHQLTAPATTWIEHKLLPAGTLQGLDLPGWRITLMDSGGWTSEPKLPAADLDRLVDTWRTARAIQVTPYTDEPPLQGQRIRALIEGKALEFIVLQREPELILLRPDQKLRYHFYGTIGQRLLTPQPQAEANPPPNARTPRGRDDTQGP